MRELFIRIVVAVALALACALPAAAQTGYDDEDSVYFLARKGHAEKLEKRLRAAPHLASTADSVFGMTLLHWAAVSGQAATIDFLLKLPGRPSADRLDGHGRTALQEAALRGHNGAVRTLVQHGADLEACSGNGRTALHYALGNESVSIGLFPRRLETIRLLVEAGADPNARDDGGATPLHWGGAFGSTEAMHALLEASSATDVNARGPGGATPLHEAARRGDPARIRLLMRHGADPFAKNDHDLTPSEVASDKPTRDALEALIREHHPARAGQAPVSTEPPRDLSRPTTRLVGHWKSTTTEGVHLYFRPVDARTGKGQMLETRPDGSRVSYPYRVLREPSAVEVVLRVENFAWGQPGTTKAWRVSPDGRRLTLQAMDTPQGRRIFVFRAVYAGARTAPAESD